MATGSGKKTEVVREDTNHGWEFCEVDRQALREGNNLKWFVRTRTMATGLFGELKTIKSNITETRHNEALACGMRKANEVRCVTQ